MALSFLFSMSVYAQKDVTQFLGIPVDGSKWEMIQKLKQKGFRNSTVGDLEGEFNGVQVYVFIETNNNKVYRIALADVANRDETNIRLRFNTLCRQFANNPKYFSMQDDQTIPEDEDISYEISTHEKRYEADFYQKPVEMDSAALVKLFEPALLSKYTKKQLKKPTEEIQSEINHLIKEYRLATLRDRIENSDKKSVWFMISEFRGEYYIKMFYDNEYNRANGEDL